MVLGFVLCNKYIGLPLSYYIIFVSLYITIKIVGYHDTGNGGKVVQHIIGIATWRYDIINIILCVYTYSIWLLSKPVIILGIQFL